MKFAIQTNLLNTPDVEKIKSAISKYPHIEVHLIPFADDFSTSSPVSTTHYIPYGSTSFLMQAHRKHWDGVFFDLATMNYRAALENHPHMLNTGVMTVADAIIFLKQQDPLSVWFIRPSDDLKQFSGQLLDAKEIWQWLQSMTEAVGGGSYYMPPTAEVVLCPPKHIQAEWRWFIVGGKIVSGSMYRVHGQLRKIRELEDNVISEAQGLADIWLPQPCVVMDTALVDGEVKVVEFNCINSSGLYDNDADAIFDALWEYCTTQPIGKLQNEQSETR